MKITFELDKTDIDNAIRAYVQHKHGKLVDKVSFNVRNTSDDRFGGGPNYELVSAEVVIKGDKI